MRRSRSWLVVAVLGALYVVAFALLHPRVGDAVVALTTIPLVAASWLVGARRGLIVGAIVVVVNIGLMQTIGNQDGIRASQIPRILVALAIGGATGWVGELTRRQRRLLDDNRRMADSLRANQEGLERAVEQRTKELVHTHEALTAETMARREAEANAATADRLAVIGTLTAGICHEINNPLAVIMANLEFIEEAMAGAAPPLAEALTDARSASSRVAEIVRHMRVFIQSKATSESADVKRVVDSTVRMVINEIRHRARMQVDVEPDATVAVAAAHLGQILLNLLINASQALPERAAHDNTIRITARRMAGANRVWIEVADSGRGISPEVQKHIFDPFFTTKPTVGTGLGLWVCHQIVEAAGGTITVTSSATGTTFRIELPGAEVETNEAIGVSAVLSRRVRMLVIDDDPAVGRSIDRMMAERHELVVVDDARRAIESIGNGERFDVILCDLMMPALNGAAFFEQLQKLAPDQAERVIFMTGGAFTPEATDFIHDGSRRLLEKPFEAKTLEAAIQDVQRDAPAELIAAVRG